MNNPLDAVKTDRASVERFVLDDGLRGPVMAEHLQGDWVAYEDYAALLAERDQRNTWLAECFKMAGADSDGNEDWRLAPDAVRAVTDLRKDYDDACEEMHGTNGLAKRLATAETEREALRKAGEVVVTTNPWGECVLVTRQDEDGSILSVIWEAPPSPQTTHWEGCWNAGKKHYVCALARMEALRKGEYICKECGLRKNAQSEPATF